MQVKDLAKQLTAMVEQGKGEFEVVHVNGVGREMDVCGFEVVEHGFFTIPMKANKRSRIDDEISKRKRERSRLRLFTHSPF